MWVRVSSRGGGGGGGAADPKMRLPLLFVFHLLGGYYDFEGHYL